MDIKTKKCILNCYKKLANINKNVDDDYIYRNILAVTGLLENIITDKYNIKIENIL